MWRKKVMRKEKFRETSKQLANWIGSTGFIRLHRITYLCGSVEHEAGDDKEEETNEEGWNVNCPGKGFWEFWMWLWKYSEDSSIERLILSNVMQIFGFSILSFPLFPRFRSCFPTPHHSISAWRFEQPF